MKTSTVDKRFMASVSSMRIVINPLTHRVEIPHKCDPAVIERLYGCMQLNGLTFVSLIKKDVSKPPVIDDNMWRQEMGKYEIKENTKTGKLKMVKKRKFIDKKVKK